MSTLLNTMKIELKISDISRQPSSFDAVVNSANSNLRFGSGVAGAIHTAAGPALEAYCEPLAPLAPGKAIITPGFNLANQWVIHVRSAHYLNDDEPEKIMTEALRAVFRLAGERHIKALAMPAIGTGVFKFPLDLAAEIIVKAIKNDAPSLAPELQRVRLCLPSPLIDRVFRVALQLNDPDDQRPKTVEATTHYLLSTLPAKTLQELAVLKKDELIQTHFGLALLLRNRILKNNYALNLDAGERNLDETSSVLVKALWETLQNAEKAF